MSNLSGVTILFIDGSPSSAIVGIGCPTEEAFDFDFLERNELLDLPEPVWTDESSVVVLFVLKRSKNEFFFRISPSLIVEVPTIVVVVSFVAPALIDNEVVL